MVSHWRVVMVTVVVQGRPVRQKRHKALCTSTGMRVTRIATLTRIELAHSAVRCSHSLANFFLDRFHVISVPDEVLYLSELLLQVFALAALLALHAAAADRC